MKETFRINNFDLIRLMAALQVAAFHAVHYLKVDMSDIPVYSLSRFFPGVPIFFFVSGFLISRSYEKNSVAREYAQNRILRIYPALITCTLVAVVSVYLTGYFAGKNVDMGEFVIWIAGQTSIVQFYNPDFMREFGTGVLNGSLWTITVELQFYLLIPILYWLFDLVKPHNVNRLLVVLIVFFMSFHVIRYSLTGEYEARFSFKLFSVTFLPWVYMFLVGVLFQRNFDRFHRILSGKVLYIALFYLFIAYLSNKYFGWRTGNGIHPLLYLLLAPMIFSFAYSFPRLGGRILRGNDISYGVYIYHMPVVNLFIYYGYVSGKTYALSVLAAAIMLATASWLIVEKNSMALKKHPLNPLYTAGRSE